MRIAGKIDLCYPCQTFVGVVKDGPNSSDDQDKYLLNNSGMLKNKIVRFVNRMVREN